MGWSRASDLTRVIQWRPNNLFRPARPVSNSRAARCFRWSGGRSTWSQEHLLPIFATVCVGLALVCHSPFNPEWAHRQGRDRRKPGRSIRFLAFYIAFMVNYYVLPDVRTLPSICGCWAVVALFTMAADSHAILGLLWYQSLLHRDPGNRCGKTPQRCGSGLAGYVFRYRALRGRLQGVAAFCVWSFSAPDWAFLSRHT